MCHLYFCQVGKFFNKLLGKFWRTPIQILFIASAERYTQKLRYYVLFNFTAARYFKSQSR